MKRGPSQNWLSIISGKFVDFSVSSCMNKIFDIEGAVMEYVFFIEFVYYALLNSFCIPCNLTSGNSLECSRSTSWGKKPGFCQLHTYIGAIVRREVPISMKNWRKVNVLLVALGLSSFIYSIVHGLCIFMQVSIRCHL